MSKKKIINKLHEAGLSPDALKQNTDDLINIAKTSLDVDDDEAKSYVSGFIGEDEHDIVGRGIEAGMNPEIEADKYEEYRQLMHQLNISENSVINVEKTKKIDESKGSEIKLTKNKLIETVTGRKIIKTIKVKDVK